MLKGLVIYHRFERLDGSTISAVSKAGINSRTPKGPLEHSNLEPVAKLTRKPAIERRAGNFATGS
jgi:hypothetical protein